MISNRTVDWDQARDRTQASYNYAYASTLTAFPIESLGILSTTQTCTPFPRGISSRYFTLSPGTRVEHAKSVWRDTALKKTPIETWRPQPIVFACGMALPLWLMTDKKLESLVTKILRLAKVRTSEHLRDP